MLTEVCETSGDLFSVPIEVMTLCKLYQLKCFNQISIVNFIFGITFFQCRFDRQQCEMFLIFISLASIFLSTSDGAIRNFSDVQPCDSTKLFRIISS